MKTRITKISTVVLSLAMLTLYSCKDADHNDNTDASEVRSDVDREADEAKHDIDHAANEAQHDMNQAADNAEANAQAAQDDWRKERDEYRAEMNRKIEKNQKDIDDAKAKAKEKS